MTYGDGVCDVNIRDLAEYHRSHGKIATITTVMLEQTKGVIDIDENNSVRAFREKSQRDSAPINAGYMVLNADVFDYLSNDTCVLEKDVLSKLADNGQLMSYVHRGFWQCMDTQRDMYRLAELWTSGDAPWKMW